MRAITTFILKWRLVLLLLARDARVRTDGRSTGQEYGTLGSIQQTPLHLCSVTDAHFWLAESFVSRASRRNCELSEVSSQTKIWAQNDVLLSKVAAWLSNIRACSGIKTGFVPIALTVMETKTPLLLHVSLTVKSTDSGLIHRYFHRRRTHDRLDHKLWLSWYFHSSKIKADFCPNMK